MDSTSTRLRENSRLDAIPYVLAAAAIGTWSVFPRAFIAEDSYFYLVVARNLALNGQQTFSGLFETNGVHPLWLYVLAAYTSLVHAILPTAIGWPGYLVPLSGALCLLGVFWLIQLARTLSVSPLLVAGAPVVLVGCLGVLGSEAHLQLCLLALLLRLIVGASLDGRRSLLVGVVAGLLFLARLDAVFAIACLLLWYLRRPETKRLHIVGVLVPPLCLGGIYLVTNQVLFGGMTPVSGWLKSSFPQAIRPALRLHPLNIASFGGYCIPLGWLPLILAGLALISLRRKITQTQGVLMPLTVGTALHAVYTAFFTAGFTYWHWYYVVPIVLGSLALGIFEAATMQARWRGALSFVAVAVLVSMTLLVLLRVRKPPHNDILLSMRTTEWVRKHVADREAVLTSEAPGQVAYYTRAHVLAADMLTGNRMLIRDMVKSGNALQHLARLGVNSALPIRYIIVNGGIFLTASADHRSLLYHHPRMAENGRVIGTLHVGLPIFEKDGILVWQLAGNTDAGAERGSAAANDER